MHGVDLREMAFECSFRSHTESRQLFGSLFRDISHCKSPISWQALNALHAPGCGKASTHMLCRRAHLSCALSCLSVPLHLAARSESSAVSTPHLHPPCCPSNAWRRKCQTRKPRQIRVACTVERETQVLPATPAISCAEAIGYASNAGRANVVGGCFGLTSVPSRRKELVLLWANVVFLVPVRCLRRGTENLLQENGSFSTGKDQETVR